MRRAQIFDMARNQLAWVGFDPAREEGVPVLTRDGWGYLADFDEAHGMCLVRLTNTPRGGRHFPGAKGIYPPQQVAVEEAQLLGFAPAPESAGPVPMCMQLGSAPGALTKRGGMKRCLQQEETDSDSKPGGPPQYLGEPRPNALKGLGAPFRRLSSGDSSMVF